MKRQHIAKFKYDRHAIERALYFLSNALQESSHNSKPVFLHSIQVAEMLWERGFEQETVIAGVLHDAVEDTDITIEAVAEEFGQRVASYVKALTISDDQTIEQSFNRCAELGSEVMSIRAADLIQNSFYYNLAPVDMQKRLQDKFLLFMDLSSNLLSDSMKQEVQLVYEQNIQNL